MVPYSLPPLISEMNKHEAVSALSFVKRLLFCLIRFVPSKEGGERERVQSVFKKAAHLARI